MNIGIIGAGFIGRALATLAIKSGHDVMISNSRDPQTLGSTAIAIGCKIGTAQSAAEFGDVVMVAIPFSNYLTLPVQALSGKIVIDANNYYPQRDGQIPELDTNATTTSELLARHLKHSRVIKAFNAILQADLAKEGRPAGAAHRRALPISGDDLSAKKTVTQLVNEFGYDVVDAGPLTEGWRFQRAMPAYCIPLNIDGLKQALAAAEVGVEVPAGSWRRKN